MAVSLHGYAYSVYTRVARMALIVKGVSFEEMPVDPFSRPEEAIIVGHPFARVPVLHHGAHRIYETAAVTTYVDACFDGPPLMPKAPLAQARVCQIIALVDSYAYWPLVREVYSHAVFRPAMGLRPEPETLQRGLAAAPMVLDALETLAAEGTVLSGPLTRADLHLAPMIAAFIQAPEGAALLRACPALYDWWKKMAQHKALSLSERRLP